MKSRRIDIASIRREQVVEAAVKIITEQGLQNLSLSEIEKKADMSRGQLMYYFPTKEDILLAVFDRLVLMMYQRIGTPMGEGRDDTSGWEWTRHLLEKLLGTPRGSVNAQFGCLQYTFLAQMGHRQDFRRRLATLYEQWRSNMALGLAADMELHGAARRVSPRALASLIQAILHGLAMQRAADPDAFDSQEMLELCLDVLGTFLWDQPRPSIKQKPARANKKGPPARARRFARQATAKGVNGERVRHE
jgi:AcrR family transcriptional regulator